MLAYDYPQGFVHCYDVVEFNKQIIQEYVSYRCKVCINPSGGVNIIPLDILEDKNNVEAIKLQAKMIIKAFAAVSKKFGFTRITIKLTNTLLAAYVYAFASILEAENPCFLGAKIKEVQFPLFGGVKTYTDIGNLHRDPTILKEAEDFLVHMRKNYPRSKEKFSKAQFHFTDPKEAANHVAMIEKLNAHWNIDPHAHEQTKLDNPTYDIDLLLPEVSERVTSFLEEAFQRMEEHKDNVSFHENLTERTYVAGKQTNAQEFADQRIHIVQLESKLIAARKREHTYQDIIEQLQGKPGHLTQQIEKLRKKQGQGIVDVVLCYTLIDKKKIIEECQVISSALDTERKKLSSIKSVHLSA